MPFINTILAHRKIRCSSVIFLNGSPRVAENDRLAFTLCILALDFHSESFYVQQYLKLNKGTNFLPFQKELSSSFPLPRFSSTYPV